MRIEPAFTSKTNSEDHLIYNFSLIETNNIVIIGILVAVILIGMALAADKNKVLSVFEAILSNRSMNQSFEDKTAFTSRSTLLLFLNYVLCFSMLSLAANNAFNFISWSSSKLILISSTFLITLFVVKRLSILLSGSISGLKNEVQEYLFNHTIFTLVAGVLLIPLLILINFLDINSGIFLQSSYLFLLLFMALRLVKSAITAIKHKVGSLFYIILYICTLEILPLVVLYKAFMSKIG